MQCESNKMVNPAVGRKRTVSCFMSHTPPSGKDNTLAVPIEGPRGPVNESSKGWGESKIFDQRAKERINHPSKIVNNNDAKNVAKHISKCFESVFLMKGFGNDGTNFGQSPTTKFSQQPDCTQVMFTLEGLKGVSHIETAGVRVRTILGIYQTKTHGTNPTYLSLLRGIDQVISFFGQI